MAKLFKYLRWKEWLMIIISIGLIVLQVYLELKMPDYTKTISTELVSANPDKLSIIWKNGGLMLVCALGSLLAAFAVGYLISKVATTFSARLRSAVFEKTIAFSMEETNEFSTASLITRTTNDITQVQTLIAMGLQFLIKAPITAIWAITKISTKSWQWTLATGVAVFVLLILIGSIIIFVLPKFRKIQTLNDNLNRVTRENLNGLRVIKAFNAEEYQEDKFEEANQELTKTNLFTSRTMAIMMPGMNLIFQGITLSIYWIGAYLVNGAELIVKGEVLGDMMAFSGYAMQIVSAFMMIAMIFVLVPRAMVSVRRINEVLDRDISIKNGHIATSNQEFRGEIEFKNVSFKYPDASQYILKDINLKIERGQTVAFIGSTGSGKSTLINLVPRFYDASEGEVLIDGNNIKDYNLETLHNKIGYVPQRAVMFSGTVNSNVSYGDNGQEKGEEQIKAAIKIAQATEFVEKMEEQYESPISQGGTNISGGQKQRLAIARSICHNPEIYIFDDSFSALDYRTDRLLRSVLNKELSDTTKLIVAQRIGTIKDADQIVVLDQGVIVGIGKHGELLQNCPVYQEIAYSQLSKEELANA